MVSASVDGRPRIVVTVGLPGCGKSTYLRKLGVPAISSDEVRGLLIDDPANQSIHGRVFATLRYVLRHRMELRRPVTYVDATNLTRKERRAYIRLGELYDCDVEALFFDVPLETCLERNRQRERLVPEEAMLRLAAKLRPPALEEGFTRITVIRD